MIIHKECPLCKSKSFGEYLICTDYFLTGEKFRLAKCNACGFVFTLSFPSEDEIGRYYESPEYYSHNDTANGFSAMLYRYSRELMLGMKLKMVTRASGINKGSLLDIGSGSGHFLHTMKKEGWDVRGIEINEKARLNSISQFGLDIMPPEGIKSIPAASFDVITLWHVLEHFQDPFGYASDIARILKPGGVCLIALPNCSSSDALHFREFWAAYDVPRHLWHFTPETFSLFAGKCGFMLKSFKPLPLDVFYISILSEKYKKSRLHLLKGLFKGLWLSILSAGRRNMASSLVFTIALKENQ
jgi:SAM-dependent methyltransferase